MTNQSNEPHLNFPSKKGTWKQAFCALGIPLLLFFSFRHFILEPFVIPSESMRPGLLIHDYILVKKFSYGSRIPFADSFFFFKSPERGDVVVFKYPPAPHLFYIKRVVGLPGDIVSVSYGRVKINDQEVKYESYIKDKFPNFNIVPEEGYDIYLESLDNYQHPVQFHAGSQADFANSALDVETFQVPDNSYFVMGDNRDNSQDSRFWGFVHQRYIVGRPWKIWLSCDETLESSSMICDPRKLRSERIFSNIK